MKMLRFLWTLALVMSIVPSLGALAQQGFGAGHDNPVGFALGYLDPQEQFEHLSFPQEAASIVAYQSVAADFATEVLRLLNVERKAAGLLPLKTSPLLNGTALAHSTVMRDQSCFSHQCAGEPTVPDRALLAGYGPYGWGSTFVGETIAAGFLDPASVVQAWMNSSGHRAIILDGQLREVGAGYVTGGYFGTYWTVDFGSQPNVLPVFINYGAAETQNRLVTLYLTNETVSGWGGIDFAPNIMISNDPGFAGAQWATYSAQKPWTLPAGNGAKTVFVKFRDTIGDVVISSAAILLTEPIPYDLAVSTHSLSFFYKLGEGFTTDPNRLVQVDNAAGDLAMTWTASIAEPWIALTATRGTTPEDVVVSVSGFQTSVLGTTQTTITITSPEAPGGSEQITVTIQAVEQVHYAFLPFIVRTNQ